MFSSERTSPIDSIWASNVSRSDWLFTMKVRRCKIDGGGGGGKNGGGKRKQDDE